MDILSCFGCDKKFTEFHHCLNHIKENHKSIKIRKCIFPNCTREFDISNTFYKHIKTHTYTLPLNYDGNIEHNMNVHNEVLFEDVDIDKTYELTNTNENKYYFRDG